MYIFPVMLSATDQKIVLSLQKNGRLSIASLARSIGVSTSTAAKRIDQLIQQNYITIRAVPNPAKMGFCANVFVTMDVDLGKVHGICSYLQKSFHVNYFCTAFGRFDILLIAFFPDWNTLHSFMRDELSQIDGVRHAETFVIQDIVKRYQMIFTESELSSTAVPIDQLDLALIRELVSDGRMSYRNLAALTGASIPTVARRVTGLLESGVIKIIALPNPSRLGYASNAILGLKAERDQVNRICGQLATRPEVTLVMTLINGFDILVGVHSANPETMYDFITNYIARINGVLDLETFIRAEIQKRYYGWMLGN